MTKIRTSIKSKAKKTAKSGLRRLGYDVAPRNYSTSADQVLRRALALAGNINTVIDVGASDGSRSLPLHKEKPDIQLLLFEAAPFHAAELRKIEGPTIHVEYAAASDHVGEVHFHLDPANPNGGGAAGFSDEVHKSTVPSVTVDQALRARGLTGPYLIKLDAQGHEFEILAGATGAIAQASLLWIEAYAVSERGRPSFDELCLHLRNLGFRAAGIADVLTRNSDGMLWQMDIAFLPDSHPAFRNPTFWN